MNGKKWSHPCQAIAASVMIIFMQTLLWSVLPRNVAVKLPGLHDHRKVGRVAVHERFKPPAIIIDTGTVRSLMITHSRGKSNLVSTTPAPSHHLFHTEQYFNCTRHVRPVSISHSGTTKISRLSIIHFPGAFVYLKQV